MPATKPVPRFVPTLTEVVQPGRPITPAAIDIEQLVQQALHLARPRLEQQLRVALHALVEQHLRVEAPRMQLELEEAIKAAVAQTIAGGARAKK
ncbi:MAG: hypothetical protein V4627_18620 [Pseudomonadota bacterium]